MPVEQQTPFNEYTGNGVTTVFAYQFQILIATDLAVFVDGVPKANGADYTISGVGNQQGGQVTFSAAPASGADVLLFRQMVLARDTDYQTNGDLREAVLDRDFDRLWLVLQGISSTVGTTLRLPFPEQAAPLPNFISRRDRMLGFNPVTGAPEMTSFTMTQVASAIAAAYGNGGTLDSLIFIQEGLGAVPRTAQEKAREIVSVKDFGAVGDGINNDTAAFNFASAKPSVFVPPGTYMVSVDVVGNFYSFVPINIVGGGSVSITLLSNSHDRLSYFSALMAAGETVKVACYGDSTTDGFATTGWVANPTSGGDAVGNSNHNLNSPNSWPVKLESMLREMFESNNISVFNAGYSGKALADGWAFNNYDRAVTNNPFYGTPHVTLITFGLNDVRPTGSQIAEFRAETLKLVNKLLAAGTLPVLVTCDPIVRNYDATNAILNREVTRQLDAAKKAQAKELEIPLIDMTEDLRAWASNNVDGYRWFLEQSTDTNGDGTMGSGDDVGLHFKDNGSAIKAQIVAKTFFTDTVIFSGGLPTRVTAADARAKAFGNFLLTLNGPTTNNDTHNAQGFNFRIDYYDANTAHRPAGPEYPMLTMWVWNTHPEAELIYRGLNNEGWNISTPDILPAPVGTSKAPKVAVKNMTTGVTTKKVPAAVAFKGNSFYKFSDSPYRFGRLPIGLSKVQYLCGDFSHYNQGSNSLFYYGYFELWRTSEFTRSTTNALARVGEFRRSFGAGQYLNLIPEQRDGSNVFSVMDGDADFPANAVEFFVDATIPIGAGVVLAHGPGYGGMPSAVDGMGSVVATVLQRTAASAVRLYLVKRDAAGNFITFARTIASSAITFTSDRAQIKVRLSRNSATDVQTVDIYAGYAGASVHSSTLDVTVAILHFAGVSGGLYWDGTLAGGGGSAYIHQLFINRS